MWCYWKIKEVDHKYRGLIPAYPYSTHRSHVVGKYYIEKHRYHTNRGAVIEVWDVYLGTGLKTILKSFSTLKAPKWFISDKVYM